MDDKYKEYQAVRHFGSLDGLRALAIVAVIWHHTAGALLSFPLAQRGFLGVDLFFVLSGFLIATLLLREARRTGHISLRAFYRRRILRIIPAYWLLLLIVGVAIVSGANASARLEHDLPFALFYISNMVPMLSFLSITWSLSTEEQFYLVVPALMKVFRTGFRWVLPFLLIASELPAFGFWPQVNLPPFFRQTTFAPIILGVMLAYALDNQGNWKVLYLVVGGRWASAAAFVVTVGVCCMPGSDISGWPRLAMQLAFAVLLGSCVVREDSAMQPILAFPPIRRIGTVSYGIYLYHFVMYGVAKAAMHFLDLSSPIVLFAVLLFITWGLAEMSYRCYELPFLRLKYGSPRIATLGHGRA